MKDMTTGSPFKLLVYFSIPLLAGNIFQQSYAMADTIIVSRTLGREALAALSATMPIGFMLIGSLIGLTNGFAVVTGHRFGAKDIDGVRRSIVTSTLISAAIVVVGTLLCVLSAGAILKAMQTPDTVFPDALIYLRVIFWGIGTIVLYNLISSILRAFGDSKTPFIFLIVCSILNIVLDLVFILSFGWGIGGAAWATAISQAVAGIGCVVYGAIRYPILRVPREYWRLSWSDVWQHLRIGVPMAVQFIVIAIGSIIIQISLNKLGDVTMAAYAVVARVDQLAIQPFLSIAIALSAFVAQNYGVKDIPRINQGMRCCVKIVLFISITGGILMIAFNQPLIHLFLRADDITEEVMRQAGTFIFANAIFYPMLALLFVFRHTLQGMGRVTAPMLTCAAEVVVRAFVAWVLIERLGYIGVCFANILPWCVAVTMLFSMLVPVMRKELREYRLRTTYFAPHKKPEDSAG